MPQVSNKNGSSSPLSGRRLKAKTSAIKNSRHISAVDSADESDQDSYDDHEENPSAVEDDDERVYDSDAIDDEDFGAKPRKRKRGKEPDINKSAKKVRQTTSSPKKSSTAKQTRRKDKDEDYEGDIVLEDGQEIVGKVVQAPTTGRVPPGQISQNTLDFLRKLKDPKCNDRHWFKLHEPVYRLAEKEWKDFVEVLTGPVSDADPQVPPLPPKDLIHRIYRDVRFSNDKTPYKTELSANYSRTGRKGVFAGYHISIQPGNGRSFVASGIWCPNRRELNNIRTNLQRSSRSLRQVLAEPEFVKFFGEPKPAKDGSRQSIFGRDDELKTAPKGVDKGHKDIDLLKCRSFCVSHHFLESEVLQPDFKEKVADVVGIMRPFVHCLNDLMTIGGGNAGPSDEEDSEDEE